MIVWPNTAGERNPRARLTVADVQLIRSLADSGMMKKDIAKQFGIAAATVSRIVRRQRWGHVTK